MSDEKKKEGGAEAAPAPEAKIEKPKAPAGGNKFLLIGLLAGVILVNTGIAFVLVKVTAPKKEITSNDTKNAVDSTKIEEDKSTHVGATTAEKPIDATVNIAGTDGERFLKVAIAFEFDDVAHPLMAEALEARSPKIKDLLIDYLSTLTLIEVTEPEAKDKIRKNMLRLVNNSIPPEEGSIRDVYIINYIIQ